MLAKRCQCYYRERRAVPSRDCENAATRLFELTRDLYTPLLIKFSQGNLAWLRQNPGSLNLCIGRDGLSIHQQEDLWNGIYESPGHLVCEDGVVRPINKSRKIGYVPGELSQLPDLSINGDYLLIKKVALKGLVEGVLLYRRQRELGFDYRAEDAIERFLDWFTRAESSEPGGSIDSRLIRAFVRGFPRISTPFDLSSDGIAHYWRY